jgi:hypothetical protein
MKRASLLAAAASAGLLGSARAEPADGGRARSVVTFAFDAAGPMSDVMPLFGADRERVWADGWDPQFVFPSPAADRPGMVFRVAHGHVEATWVNTQLDFARGAVQYVYVVPGAMTSLITIHASPRGAGTHVEVTYERTALDPAANDHVMRMADGDKSAGPDWARQINAYLAKATASRPAKR